MRQVSPPPNGSLKPRAPAVLLKSSRGLPDWPGFTVSEGADSGGMVHNLSNPDHRVFVAIGGDIETWWRADGVARWRRTSIGAISAAPPGPNPNCSWTGTRHYAHVNLPASFLRSVLRGDELRRLNAMPAHVCLHEYYRHADRGVAVVLGLRRLLHEPDPARAMQAETLAIQLVQWMAELAGCQPSSDPTDGLSRSQLRRVVERIDSKLDQPLTLRELAQIADVSPFHFCRMFKRNTGVSPWQFVIRWRVDRAVDLLKDRHASISSIAAACGFTDQSHLTRAFKKVRGITPGHFHRPHQSQV